ncbi:Src y 2 domain protein [Dermatophagoides pteronyssinus]|uniref:Src y 2 domain protein n=1 Tax=Dermatophagoides pteronyssinus TaxID=6956 RepID=A0ABQ8J3Y5_DERPT|nr:Src y 2 domain protein [Dermatophagoides pteronyssinus]
MFTYRSGQYSLQHNNNDVDKSMEKNPKIESSSIILTENHNNHNHNHNKNEYHQREIIKESIVNYLTIGCDEMDDEIEKNWEKCRLVLVRTENDIMLEFFPPDNKSIQPKSGLLCNMLDEIRQTKPLEMPERPYTALLRFANFIDYIIEFKNGYELIDWIRKIRSNLPKQQQNVDNDDEDDLYESNDDLYDLLKTYPWFHCNVNRSESSDIVMNGGKEWSGVFLIRKSQTHFGECVLTFNYLGKQAKHFRIIIKGPKSECQIERLCFRSIIDLIEYFRKNPIPLRHQTDQEPAIVLTSFVIFEDNKFDKYNQDNRQSSFFNRRSFIHLMDNARWLTSSSSSSLSSSTKQSINVDKNPQISNESVRLTRDQLILI